jgi:hypothetical protein
VANKLRKPSWKRGAGIVRIFAERKACLQPPWLMPQLRWRDPNKAIMDSLLFKKENDILKNIRQDAVELWHTYHGDC